MKKRSCVCLICILICISTGVKGQKLIVENGVAITALPKVQYKKNQMPYQMSVGYNYMEKGWYFLSSNIGYLQKGGRDGTPKHTDIAGLEYWGEDAIKLHYITVNTVFNLYKMSGDGYKFFAGAGPRIDFKVGSYFSFCEKADNAEFSYPDPSELIRPVSVGLKLVVGVTKEIGSLDLGLNFAYLPTFNNPGKYGTNLRDRTFTVGVTLGLPWFSRVEGRTYTIRRSKE